MLYFCVAYLIFIFSIWLIYYLRWQLYPPLKIESPIFNFLKIHFEIVKIKNNLYYYKGLYITDNAIIHNNLKFKHFENKGFLFRYLKSI